MIEFIIVATIIGIIWFIYNKPSLPRRSITESSSTGGFNFKLPKLPEQVPWKIIFITAIVMLVIFFTEEIVNFDWTSISLGRAVEKHFGAGTSMWIWAPIVIVIVVYFGNKVSGAAANGVLVVFCVAGLAVTFMLSIFGEDKLMDGVAVMSGGQPKDGGVDCLDREKAQKLIFYKGSSKDITICPSSGTLYLYALNGATLNLGFSPKFASDNNHIVSNKDVSDFVVVARPMTYPGSIAGSYKLSTMTSANPNRPDFFEKTGLKYVTITVTAN